MPTSEPETATRGTQSTTEVIRTYRILYISAVLVSAVLIGVVCWQLLDLIPKNYRSLTTKNDVWEIFFSIFGLVYAIIVGLFVIEAHRRMRELASLVQNESNAADDIIDFLQYFKESEQTDAIDKIKGQLLSYAESLPHNLRHLYNREHHQDWRKTIELMIGCVESLKPVTPASKSALDGLVRKVADLTTFRSETMEVARRGFPLPFYLLLVIMPIVVIVGFALMNVDNDNLHKLIIATIAVVMWLLLALVWDLDHPRRAIWNIQGELSDYVIGLKQRLASDRG